MISPVNPRYQIFVSSTYTDLAEERHAVREAILELEHFPAGMEIFPATDSTPWELIEKIISESDYYVVVIGGRYGSVDEKGLSFTEREYDLAEKLGIPILAFVHADPDAIPAGKVERSESAQQKLEAFRTKALRRTCKTWSSPDDLKSVVMLSLIYAFRTQPQRGWIRAGGPDVTDILARLADLQQRYDDLARANEQLRGEAGAPISRDLAGGDDLVELLYSLGPADKEERRAAVSWNELFFAIADKLVTETEKYVIVRALSYMMALKLREAESSDFKELARRLTISEESFTLVMLQFIALGLIETSSVMRTRNLPGPGPHEYLEQVWKLTRRGMITFLGKRVRMKT